MTDTPTISQDSVNAVLQRLDALAAKLGVTAQYIYGIYVQQARVEAIRDTVYALFSMIISALLALLCVSLFRRGIAKDNYDEWPFVTGTLVGIASAGTLFFSLIAFYSAIGEWLNPEFWALSELFKAIR